MKYASVVLALLVIASCRICSAAEPNAIHDKVARNTTVQGFPCAKGDVWFYPDGSLDECTLSSAAAIGDLRIPRGSIIEMWPGGGARLVMLPRPANLAGYRVRGGTRPGLSRGATTAFYKTGELRSFYLTGKQTIQGVPCSGGPWNTLTDPTGSGNLVELYPDGKIESCKLSHDFAGFHGGERIVLPRLNVAFATVAANSAGAAQ